jgi:hypothetical protein
MSVAAADGLTARRSTTDMAEDNWTRNVMPTTVSVERWTILLDGR